MQIIHNPAGAGITLGGIVAFTTLQSRLFFLLGQLLNVQVEIQGALALFDRVFEHLDLPIGTQIGGMSAYLEEQKKRGRKTDARILQRIAQVFGPYKVQVALILIAIIFATILGLVNPLMIRYVTSLYSRKVKESQYDMRQSLTGLGDIFIRGAASFCGTYRNRRQLRYRSGTYGVRLLSCSTKTVVI